MRRAVRVTVCAGLLAALALVDAPASNATTLPDGRGYELVSTLDPPSGFGLSTAFGGVSPRGVGVVAADGDSVAFTVGGSPPGSDSGALFQWELSQRTSAGWAARALDPPQQAEQDNTDHPAFVAFSDDLSTAVIEQENPPLVPAAVPDVNYLYGENTEDGGYSLVSGTPEPPELDGSFFYVGSSADAGTVAYETGAGDYQTGDTPASVVSNGDSEVYESIDGHVELAAILPDGTPNPNGGIGAAPGPNQVSANGADVFLNMQCAVCYADTELYARVDGDRTVDVSASQRATADPNGPQDAGFAGVSSDGSLVFFTSSSELTDDANTGSGPSGPTDAGNDLYEYDLDTGALVDLTPDSNPADAATGADVQGGIEISQDGSAVSFVADGDLAGAAVSGQPNLYVEQGGTVHFVATLSPNDTFTPNLDGSVSPVANALQMTPDGQTLLFESQASLTGYDNDDAATGNPDDELYRYSVDDGQLICVSCNPTGAQPLGSSITIPAEEEGKAEEQLGGNISADGDQVFFESDDALVPQDTNGVSDVYEWEQDGTGTCDSSVDAGGCVSLLTGGQQGDPALLIGSDPSGSNVFVSTEQSLVPQDTNGVNDLYDVRVGGGFPSPPPAPSPPPCTATACQTGPATVPPAPVVATVGFSGPGNPRQEPAARASVLSRHVRGARVAVRVRVPGAGHVTLSGPLLRTVRRSFSHRGSATMTVSLTGPATAELARRGTLKGVRLRVGYVPRSGRGAARTISITFTEGHR